MSLDLSSKQSLCVLRLSAIGDVCHAVAMVQAIQRQYSNLSITWVVGKLEYQLVKHIPHVNFIIFDKSQGWRSYRNLRKALAGHVFDVLLHMQVALRASVASLMIKAKVKIGFDNARAKEGQWLFTNRKIEAQHQPHVLDGFMGFAKAVGVVDITPKWTIPIMNDDVEWVKSRFPAGKVLVICAAASKAERNWLPERYAEVADHAVSKGYQVVLCGGPTVLEKELAKKIESSAQQSLVNLVGQTTLLQLLEILKQADCVLAPDTGPAHMATTQETKVIGLYAHSNPYRTGPYSSLDSVVSVYEQVVAEQHDEGVSWGTRMKGRDLMSGIMVEQVTALIE